LLQDEEDNNRKRGEILNELWEIFDNIALIYKQQHGREVHMYLLISLKYSRITDVYLRILYILLH